MDEDLITKKELLALTGISYGSLYRWKRMDLIPDQWFIHKATYTGQETFFPRGQILERIARIKDMKDGMSLDDIAESFSSSPVDVEYTADEIVEKSLVTRAVLDLYMEHTGDRGPFGFEKLLKAYLLERLLRTSQSDRSDALEAVTLASQSDMPDDGYIIIARKMGVAFVLVLSAGTNASFDTHSRIAERISISELRADLKEALAKII